MIVLVPDETVPEIVLAVASYVAVIVPVTAGVTPKSLAFEDVKLPLLDVPDP